PGARSGERREISRRPAGRIRRATPGKSRGAASHESAAGTSEVARATSHSWVGKLVRIAGHVGSPRLDSPASNLAGHGPSVPRGSGTVAEVPGRFAMCRPQFLTKHHIRS